VVSVEKITIRRSVTGIGWKGTKQEEWVVKDGAIWEFYATEEEALARAANLMIEAEMDKEKQM